MAENKKPIEDFLFKRMPKAIKALNAQARKEERNKQRAQWAAQNLPNR